MNKKEANETLPKQTMHPRVRAGAQPQPQQPRAGPKAAKPSSVLQQEGAEPLVFMQLLKVIWVSDKKEGQLPPRATPRQVTQPVSTWTLPLGGVGGKTNRSGIPAILLHHELRQILKNLLAVQSHKLLPTDLTQGDNSEVQLSRCFPSFPQ